MKRYGYHRTSTREQHLDRGIKEITVYCEQNQLELEKIYTDQQTGKNFNRPRYQVLKEDVLRPGDELIIVWKNKLHCERTHFSYFGLNQYLDKVDGIKIATAFLSRHYRLLHKETGEPLIAKSCSVLKVKLKETYSKNMLEQEYMQGHPCAVEIMHNEKSRWFPVIFVDDEDAIIADFDGQRHVFLSEYDNIVNVCSFEKVK